MTSADRVSGLLLLAFSAVVMQQARALPYWTADAPGPGFVPFWLGGLLGCLAIALIVRRAPPRRHDESVATGREPLVAMVVALTAGAAALSLVAGLVLASGLFTAVTLAYLHPGHVRGNIALSVATPIVVWLVFVRWLGVALPAGPFGF
jgi:putative tricarboxylic transport membrane protein